MGIALFTGQEGHLRRRPKTEQWLQ